MPPPFRIGLTRDFLKPDGTVGFGDIGLSLLDGAPHVAWEFLAENAPELRSDQVAGYDWSAPVTDDMLSNWFAFGPSELPIVEAASKWG